MRHHLQCGQTPERRPRGGAQIQQAAERLERNFVDSRQLKVCATCFDLSVSLLRVLEMTITLVPEIFLDWAQHNQINIFKGEEYLDPDVHRGKITGSTTGRQRSRD